MWPNLSLQTAASLRRLVQYVEIAAPFLYPAVPPTSSVYLTCIPSQNNSKDRGKRSLL
jgi:hypothetical protein